MKRGGAGRGAVAQAQRLVELRPRRRSETAASATRSSSCSSVAPQLDLAGREVRVHVRRLAQHDVARARDDVLAPAAARPRANSSAPFSGWKTTCTSPERSRRSTKISRRGRGGDAPSRRPAPATPRRSRQVAAPGVAVGVGARRARQRHAPLAQDPRDDLARLDVRLLADCMSFKTVPPSSTIAT